MAIETKCQVCTGEIISYVDVPVGSASPEEIAAGGAILREEGSRSGLYVDLWVHDEEAGSPVHDHQPVPVEYYRGDIYYTPEGNA